MVWALNLAFRSIRKTRIGAVDSKWAIDQMDQVGQGIVTKINNLFHVAKGNIIPMPEEWSKPEVAIIISDYSQMLTAEVAGKDCNKTQHRRAILSLLKSNRKFKVPT